MAGGKSPKGNAKREEILRVALDVFANSGDDVHSSLREVARRCGTTTGGILYYFGSKENLLVEILKSRDVLSLDVDPEEDENSPYGNALQQDSKTYYEQIREVAKNPGLVALFLSQASQARNVQHPASEFFRKRYERQRRYRAQYLENRGVKPRHGLSAEAASLLASAITDGVQLQWLADPSIDMTSAIHQGMAMLYDFSQGNTR
ncbi:TetR/AcrR family transcriptional regulator [Arthrobacter woluwensis]|uniref:TetR/AcrR family transcriptional regulator n=1 Tax=Arthrobacter woluwensis TaxID=156980 RepID=UPI0015E78833|nr:TetR/AcrR family transcriptional regulator [Arthrobacter woluwensis]